MAEPTTGTAADIEPFVREARELVDGSRDAETFKRGLIRMIGEQDVLLPGEAWTFVNEMFYAVEEHVSDPESRRQKAGLDDGDLAQVVGFQLPALEAELHRVRAGETGGSGQEPGPTATAGHDLLGLVRALGGGELPAQEFAAAFSDSFERGRAALGPRALAAAGAVRAAVARFAPDASSRRLYEIDEVVLRARVAAVEPRLAAAVEP